MDGGAGERAAGARMRPRTLQWHLLVLTLATLLPMVVFGTTAVVLIGRRERAVFERGATERTLALLTAVDTELNSHVTSLQLLASSESLATGDVAEFRDDVARTLPTQPYWRSVSLLLPSGRRLFDSRDPRDATLPRVRDRDSFEAALRTGRPAIGSLYREGDTFQFAIRMPVMRDGRAAYVLSVVVDPAAILALLTPQRLPPDWVGVVLDANRRIVARTMDQRRTFGRFAAKSLRAALDRGSEGWFQGTTLEGTEVYAPYTRSAFSGWTVALGIPTPVVEAGAAGAQRLLGLGVLAAVLTAILLAMWVSRLISSPIAALASTANALGRGERVTTPPRGNVREVGEVSRALMDAAAAVREREDALRAADRAKDEFLAMLAHELRNPLSALAAAAQVLQLAGPRDGPAQRAAAVVGRQVRHMTRMVDDLLDVSRVTTGKVNLARRPMDLAEVAAATVRAFRSAGRLKDHDVHFEGAPAWVDADEARVEQILSNLLGNALKFTPPGGRIDVRVGLSGDAAVLEVVDNGMGLAPELVSRVFDLFVQGERSLDRGAGGLGVGLTLVRRLAELHGGSATAASEGPGRGACFRVSFPAIEAPPAAVDAGATAAGAAASGADGGRARLLLVEDNADARESLREALELRGYDVAAAADGAAALAAARAVRPDIAIVDIGLPGIDGYEVARRLRTMRAGSEPFLVALTGYGQPDSRRRAREAGFEEYVIKPASPEVLARMIEAHLAAGDAAIARSS